MNFRPFIKSRDVLAGGTWVAAFVQRGMRSICRLLGLSTPYGIMESADVAEETHPAA
jgi:hypothetical protein